MKYLILSAVLLTGCMDMRECKQACWPHPIHRYEVSFGGSECGCVQEAAPSRAAPQADPTASAILAAPKPKEEAAAKPPVVTQLPADHDGF